MRVKSGRGVLRALPELLVPGVARDRLEAVGSEAGHHDTALVVAADVVALDYGVLVEEPDVVTVSDKVRMPVDSGGLGEAAFGSSCVL